VAVKQVRVSDLSGRQATEEFAKLIVHEHPQYQGPITLDELPEELGELPTATSKGKPAAQRGRELGVDGASAMARSSPGLACSWRRVMAASPAVITAASPTVAQPPAVLMSPWANARAVSKSSQ
jgi:hypothetical protein